jgi:hypothetical protein
VLLNVYVHVLVLVLVVISPATRNLYPATDSQLRAHQRVGEKEYI